MSIGNEGTRAYGGPITSSGLRHTKRWVLLFVRTGNTRPKVAARHATSASSRVERFAELVAWARTNLDTNLSKPLRAAAEADEWWLVECNNARGGLWMIAPEWCNGRTTWPPPTGCILASGGKETTA